MHVCLYERYCLLKLIIINRIYRVLFFGSRSDNDETLHYNNIYKRYALAVYNLYLFA